MQKSDSRNWPHDTCPEAPLAPPPDPFELLPPVALPPLDPLPLVPPIVLPPLELLPPVALPPPAEVAELALGSLLGPHAHASSARPNVTELRNKC